MISNASMPHSTVIPVLAYPDVPAAVVWLVSTFGFVERLSIGDHRVQLIYDSGDLIVVQGNSIPSGHSLMVRVTDVDSHFQRVKDSGAKLISAPETFPYGERQYAVSDIGGHSWTFSQSVQDVDPSSWGGQLHVPQPNSSFKPNPLRGSA